MRPGTLPFYGFHVTQRGRPMSEANPEADRIVVRYYLSNDK
jgi:hypothetical protein